MRQDYFTNAITLNGMAKGTGFWLITKLPAERAENVGQFAKSGNVIAVIATDAIPLAVPIEATNVGAADSWILASINESLPSTRFTS